MPRFNVDKNQEVNTQAQTNQQVVDDKLAEGNLNVTPKLTQQEAAQKLSALVQEVYEKLQEAQNVADEHGLNFSLDVEYGMGGYYEDGEWHASSQSC